MWHSGWLQHDLHAFLLLWLDLSMGLRGHQHASLLPGSRQCLCCLVRVCDRHGGVSLYGKCQRQQRQHVSSLFGSHGM
jgi:hypothetical protein